MLSDLDVYVATSMRSHKDFRTMAETCEHIFSDSLLKEMNLRYFDPTLSAAGGHEDKGLIECLMVKCAKVLVYFAGEKESYGKDAEAAMALSLGKAVIFYCDQEQLGRFYRDVHPLSFSVKLSREALKQGRDTQLGTAIDVVRALRSLNSCASTNLAYLLGGSPP